MSLATIEIYRTESGSVYEVAGGRIRRVGGDGGGPLDDWVEYKAIHAVPAALLRPGSTGDVLEIVLATGRRVLTSRLVTPAG